MRSLYAPLIFLAFLQPLTAAPAAKNPPPPPPPPYDADLFHKDAEVCFVDAEFLYWNVNEGALDYAQKMTQPAWSAVSPSYASGHVKSASFDLDPGVRIAIGYFNAPKYWEVSGQYTHLISRGKNGVGAPSAAGEFLTGTWPQIATTTAPNHAHSHIFFDYNLFNLQIDRMYITNPHLRLRLLAGLSAAWMSQDWKVQYLFNGLGSTTIRNRWHFVGGGMRLGLSADWYWGNNIYLTGETVTALYMGSYSNLSKQTTTFALITAEDNTSLPVRNSNYRDTRPAFAAQFLLGPSWQQNFGCNNRVEVFVGYELTGWFNLQEIRRSSKGTPTEAKETWMSTSMIGLQGLTTRLTVDF